MWETIFKNGFSNYLFICNLIIFLSTFSKNGSKWLGGIENEYHDPCQERLDLINNKLTSPNYPDRIYDPNTICKWNLTTEKGNYISLDFELINVSDNIMFLNV